MSVTAARGFVAAGVACGIKESGALDLALVTTDDGRPGAAAGVFTANLATAAPVVVSRRHLASSGGRAIGVILNSGNANAATGSQGVADAEAMCRAVAGPLGGEPTDILVCSTGLIGIPLPVDLAVAAGPELVAARAGGPAAGLTAARAIMTTDTRAKEAVRTAGSVTIGGMAKGAAMLAPNMATMLAVVTTDADLAASDLRTHLAAAVRDSFNALSVDGCTSTNDTVLLLSSGRAGPAAPDAFAAALAEVCADLAGQMAADAEGATKVVRVRITGALDDEEAQRAARRVAESQLVKCSFFGADPYWGRVVSELGSAGVAFDLEKVSVAYGGVTVARGGCAVPHDDGAVRAHLAQRDVEVHADLGIGPGAGLVLTNDLTPAYIDENMRTS
ncbi:MAG: bifunctional glutamate N-acetyltransferase/amino-acid acetyltransferase ArgJ [Acidimicrobiales bacterium]